MGIQSILTSLPKSSAAYVFGSFIKSCSPKDIDILVVYDQQDCPPPLAHQFHAKFAKLVEKTLNLDVDLTLLTMEEERGNGFIQDTGAIPFETAIAKLTQPGWVKRG